MSEKVVCKIPLDILNEYHICTDYYETDVIGTYQTFLWATDYKITKLYEQLVMHPEKADEIKAEFLQKNSELMGYRQIAREELGPLIDELYDLAAYKSQYGENANAEKAQDAINRGAVPDEDCDECKLDIEE